LPARLSAAATAAREQSEKSTGTRIFEIAFITSSIASGRRALAGIAGGLPEVQRPASRRGRHRRLLVGLLLCLLSALALAPRPALAHDAGLARIGITATDSPTVTLQLDGRITDLVQILGLPENVPLPPRLFEAALPDALPTWLAVQADGAPCPLELLGWGRLDALALRMEITAACPAAPRDLTVLWPAGGHPALRWAALVVIEGLDTAVPLVLDRGLEDVTVRVGEAPPVWETLWRFGGLGAQHIAVGWDHLAFLLALVLGCGRLRRLLAVVTAFTVAHSLTLALGATGVVDLEPALVEPVIALSITVAAALALYRLRRGTLDHPGRADDGADRAGPWALVMICFGFGLIHGFGFAGLLADRLPAGGERLWPLLGFNLGVEAGQVALVALTFPLLVAVGRHRFARPAFGALLVALVALGLAVTVLRVV